MMNQFNTNEARDDDGADETVGSEQVLELSLEELSYVGGGAIDAHLKF
jgi:hypothetical protein